MYLNGEYMRGSEAKVSIFDRGFLMADGIYEVTSVMDSKLLDFGGHTTRLQRSLSELDMRSPISMDDLLLVHRELVERNNLVVGMIYLQITRGAPSKRDFMFPNPDETPSTIVLFTSSMPSLVNSPLAQEGMKIISIDDLRWGRRDIKTTQLLYPSMGKMMAKKVGADDAWMVEDGFVTEGTSNNAYIIKGTQIITRAPSNAILNGITRAAIFRYAELSQMEVEERAFTIEEAKEADEAFITSATTFVMPVVSIDGVLLGSGVPGPKVPQLRSIYIEEMRKTAI